MRRRLLCSRTSVIKISFASIWPHVYVLMTIAICLVSCLHTLYKVTSFQRVHLCAIVLGSTPAAPNTSGPLEKFTFSIPRDYFFGILSLPTFRLVQNWTQNQVKTSTLLANFQTGSKLVAKSCENLNSFGPLKTSQKLEAQSCENLDSFGELSNWSKTGCKIL